MLLIEFKRLRPQGKDIPGDISLPFLEATDSFTARALLQDQSIHSTKQHLHALNVAGVTKTPKSVKQLEEYVMELCKQNKSDVEQGERGVPKPRVRCATVIHATVAEVHRLRTRYSSTFLVSVEETF